MPPTLFPSALARGWNLQYLAGLTATKSRRLCQRSCANLASLIPLYVAQDLPDAELLLERLAESGVEAIVRNRDLEAGLSEFPWSSRPEVCILEPSDLTSALAVKEAYVAAQASTVAGNERQCGHCRELSPPNFELCWKCRTPFDE